MAVYEITSPDGSVYRLEGPEGASQRQLINAVQTQQREERTAALRQTAEEAQRRRFEVPTEAPKTTLGGNILEFGKGLIPGAVGLAETAATGISALLPEDTEQIARSKIAEIAAGAKKPFEAAPGYEDSVSRKLSEGLGSTLPFFALGPLGVAGRVVGAGLGVAAGAGEARQAAEAAGITGAQRGTATLLGAPTGLLDIIAPELKPFKNVLVTAAARGGIEGLTEAAQKVAQNLIAKGVYNPEQPILVGSGEEGAYGAGVGALASLIIDMTIGRRARGAGTQPPGTTPPAVQPSGAPIPTEAQRDLFPAELRTAETAAMPPAPPTPPAAGTQGELFKPAEAPVPLPMAEPAVAQAGQMDMFAPAPAPVEETRVPEQRDMIDESETAQLEEMQRVEAIAPVVGERNEAEIQKLRGTAAAAQEQERLKFESDLAEIDSQLKTTREKTTEDKRLALLLPIVEDTSVKNISQTFENTLKEQGFTDTGMTLRERRLIRRAYDVRMAETPEVAPAPAVPVSPDVTAKETRGLEELVPEKKAKVVQPEQLQLPGVPKPKVPAPAAEAPTPPVSLLSARALDQLGVLKAAPVRQELVNKDLSVPADREAVRSALTTYAANPQVSPRARTIITNFVNNPIFKQQAEMFGPKGGVLKQPAAAKPAPVKETKGEQPSTKPEGVRVSPVSGAPETRRAAGVGAPKPVGVGVSGTPTTKPEAGKAVQPAALKKEAKAEPKAKAAPKAEPKAEVKTKAAKEVEKKKDDWVASNFGAPVTSAFENRFTGTKKLEKDEAADFGTSLSKDTVTALKENNLVGALNELASTSTGTASRIARVLASNMGSTKVEVRNNLKDEAGKAVPGYYDPATNTIYLDTEAGTDNHTFLHEATHAATSHVLDNKSHPVTKQLTQLFNDVKDSLDTAYGASSLDEFVAEAWGNPEFQAKLNAINPKGGAITAWQRFRNTVTNYVRSLLGMSTKPLGSAFDTTDRLIADILAPAPDARDAGTLYAMSLTGKGDEVFKSLAKQAESLPYMTPERVDKFHEFFTGTMPDMAKNAVRMSLPLNALVDVAKKYIKSAPLLDRLVNEKSGSESKRNEQIEATVNRAEAWASRNPTLLDPLNGIVYESTLTRVDPTKPRSEYEGKTDKSGNKLDEIWDGMQKEVKQLGPEGMAIYSMMRNSYKKLYEQILKTIDSRIDEAMDDKARSAIVKKEIYARLTSKGGFDPYFPLTRSGSYWLSYNAVNPRTGNKELYVEAFETKRARDRAQEEYATHGAENFEEFVNVSQINYRSAPATSFVSGVLKVMEANKVDPTVIDETMRLFLTTLPETSFAQSFRTRKGTLGFKQDAVGALREKTLSISRQLANMEYAGKFANLRTEMLTEFKESGSKADAKPYLEEMNKRIDFAISPQVPTWSKVATSMGFNMTLGFNLSSALVNLAQIPLVVTPYLGGKYGYGATTKALGEATRIFTTSGFKQDIETFVPTETGEKKVTARAMPSLDNIDFDAKGLDPRVKRLKTLAQIAGDLGQLNRSQMYEVLDVDKSKSVLTTINAASGFVFHHGERMNRQVSLIAAYNLELDRLNSDKATAAEKALSDADKETAAAEQAIYMTELTNGGTAAAAAPRIAQSGLGKVVFMFKRYGVSMYYMMYKSAREALQSTDPETRKIAMRQIAGIYGSAALMAGVQGVPMFGIAAMVYNLFKDDDEDDFDTATRKYIGETLYSGGLNELTGLTIASRIGLSDLLIRDTQKKESQTVMLSALEMMGGPVYGVGTRVERGVKLINEGNIVRGVESILPSAFGNVMKAIRYSNEGVDTLRGDPITGEVSASNVFAQAFGFAPAEYTRQLEINSRLKEADKEATGDKSKYLKQFYVATRMGDTDEAQEALKNLQELGKKHPGLKITGETIVNSMRQHARQSATMYHGISLSRGMRAELLADAAEYDGDTYGNEE